MITKRIPFLAILFSLVCLLVVTTTGFAESDSPVDEIPEEETFPIEDDILDTSDVSMVDEPTNDILEDSTGEPQEPASDAIEPSEEIIEVTAETTDTELQEQALEDPAEETQLPEESFIGEEPVETTDMSVETDLTSTNGNQIMLEYDEPESSVMEGVDVTTEDILSDESKPIGDPWWKVGTTTYMTVFNTGDCPPGTLNITCWASPTPISLALTKIEGGLMPSDRKLYLEAGIFSEAITIDGAGSNLTYLKGLIGVPSLYNVTYDTKITNTITVSNVSNGFTLSGMDVAGSITFSHNTGTLVFNDIYLHGSEDGLRVLNHNGQVKIDKVKVEGNRAGGVWVDNRAGNAAKVDIKNSSFNANTTFFNSLYGIKILSKGAVYLDGVSASQIDGDGLKILQAGSVTIKNSVFSSNFNSSPTPDFGYGIDMQIGTGTVNVSLDNVFLEQNVEKGLRVVTNGRIILENVVANSNLNDGAYLDNCNMVETIHECLNPLSSYIKITNSEFSNNGDVGLEVYSKGNINLSSIKSQNNNSYGVFLRNNPVNQNTGEYQGNGNVVINIIKSLGVSGANIFSSNGQSGLFIGTNGSVLLQNFDADNNNDGVRIYNNYQGKSKSVTISTTLKSWFNSCSSNTLWGLKVVSTGPISVNGVYSFNNGLEGIVLQNQDADFSKNVTLKNTIVDSNNEGGIWVYSKGAVTVSNVDSSNNTGDGNGITIQNDFGTRNVTINTFNKYQQNNFDNNSGYGVHILSLGSVTVKNSDANLNGSTGISIGDSVIPKTVSISSGSFSSNNGYGLYLKIIGNINLDTITASSNTLDGVWMDNCLMDAGMCTGSGSITIKGKENEFSDNGERGIEADSFKNISLTNVNARNNQHEGIHLENAFGDSTGSITIKTTSNLDYNQITNNGLTPILAGMRLVSRGAVNIQVTNSSDNSGPGVRIENGSAGKFKPIKILRSNFSGNYQSTGVSIDTNSPVTISNVFADNNADWGIYVVSSQNVSINCTYSTVTCSTDDNLIADGIYVNTDGTINIKNMSANSNGNTSDDHGMELISSIGKVTLSNVMANDNFNHGLKVVTPGNISIQNISTANNVTGLELGTFSDYAGIVYISGNNTVTSNQYGLIVWSTGTVNLKNVTAYGQTAGNGLEIHANGLGNTVTLMNIVSLHNNLHGITMETKGNTYLSNISSFYNGSGTNNGDGLQIQNNVGSLVSIKNGSFIYNAGNGIQLGVLDPSNTSLFKMVNVNYFGNDRDRSGSYNLSLSTVAP